VGAPVLALDIGGTKLTAGVVAPAGRALAVEVKATDPGATPLQVLDALSAMSEKALSGANLRLPDLAAVGVSFGGPVDYPSGRTVTCHHLPGWEDIPLRDLAAERSGLPAVVDNDANAAAFGEWAYGAARGRVCVLYLTVSTGIGGGLVLNGQVHRGANSMAGEIGHTVVVPGGPRCTCGRRGCLEAVAAGPAIASAAQAAVATGETTSLSRVPCESITARDVAAAANGGDTLAAQVMAQAGDYLGVAIAAAVNLLNPDMVVIGGGVSQAGECLFAPVRAAVMRLAVPDSAEGLHIVAGALREQGALLGAAAMAFAELTTTGPR